MSCLTKHQFGPRHLFKSSTERHTKAIVCTALTGNTVWVCKCLSLISFPSTINQRCRLSAFIYVKPFLWSNSKDTWLMWTSPENRPAHHTMLSIHNVTWDLANLAEPNTHNIPVSESQIWLLLVSLSCPVVRTEKHIRDDARRTADVCWQANSIPAGRPVTGDRSALHREHDTIELLFQFQPTRKTSHITVFGLRFPKETGAWLCRPRWQTKSPWNGTKVTPMNYNIAHKHLKWHK